MRKLLLPLIGICLFGLFYVGCRAKTTEPTELPTPTPTPNLCECSRGTGLIRNPGGFQTDVVIPYERGYSATMTTWFNSQGQVLPEECSWNRVVDWKEILNGGCVLYGSAGDASLRFMCTVPTDLAIARSSAIIGGKSCPGEIRFQVSRD